jgi:hypothetical protein
MSLVAAPHRSAAQWQARLVAQEMRGRSRTWWDAWPWNGTIADEDFQRVVNYCRAKFGHYSPIIPLRHPEAVGPASAVAVGTPSVRSGHIPCPASGWEDGLAVPPPPHPPPPRLAPTAPGSARRMRASLPVGAREPWAPTRSRAGEPLAWPRPPVHAPKP